MACSLRADFPANHIDASQTKVMKKKNLFLHPGPHPGSLMTKSGLKFVPQKKLYIYIYKGDFRKMLPGMAEKA